jgi:HAD superfamily hydrolase (TIGR01549 family)
MEAVKLKYKLEELVIILVEKYEHFTHTYPNPLRYEKLHGTKNIKNAFFKILKYENKIPDYDWFWREYLKAHLKEVRLNKFAKAILNDIKARNIHQGLISDVDDCYLYKQLEALGILKLFDSITTSEEVGVRKPSSKIFRVALKKAQCNPENALYVGDNIERDILGAKAVGMIPILFSSSLIRETTKSDIIKIKSLSKLHSLISKLPNEHAK